MTDKTPDTTKILITHADDTVTITSIVLDDKRDGVWEATTKHIDAVVSKIEQSYSMTPGFENRIPFKGWREMSAEEIEVYANPQGDRSFRDAWKHTEDKDLHICVDTAKTVLRARLRNKRLPLLDKLDVEGQRALEDGDTAKLAEIKAKKQKLRDLPAHPDIEDAETIEDLKAITIETHGV